MTKKKKTTRKAPTKRAARKKAKPTPRPYVEPKTAYEQGHRCKALIDGTPCGKAPVWFDFELGEKDWSSGIVCDLHKVSKRLEKLKQPQAKEVAT